MTVTLDVDEELLRDARKLTGIKGKKALIDKALRELVQWEAGKRLAEMGGTMPNFKAGRRRRSKKTR
jgi:Arc/MetJ family transcription regulator